MDGEGSNKNILKKINDMLDNSLNLNNLTGSALGDPKSHMSSVPQFGSYNVVSSSSSSSHFSDSPCYPGQSTPSYVNNSLASVDSLNSSSSFGSSLHGLESLLPDLAASGVLNSRALEQLQEAMRPKKDVRLMDHRQKYKPETRGSPGVIGERCSPPADSFARAVGSKSRFEYAPPGYADNGSFGECDSSGIGSSGSNLSSDTSESLIELMNSLSLNQVASAMPATLSPIGCLSPHQFSTPLLPPNQPLVSPQLGGPAPRLNLLRVLGLQGSGLSRHEELDHIAAAAAAANSPASLPGTLPPAHLMSPMDRRWALGLLFGTNYTDPYSIERAAKLYRNAANICEASCTWSGQLPPRNIKNPAYSCKVFLGGVPWDVSEAGLQSAFRSFGPLKIEWPGKEGRHPRYPPKAGYVYVLFECERSVKSLLAACTHDLGGEYYYKISSRRMRSKDVQVIPWVMSDSNFVRQPSQRLEPGKTVFVGALHGMLNAEGLAHILNDLFGNVLYAGIDTDKHKYPIGSGRVTFSSHKSYVKAVTAAFIEVKTQKFTKKIQIDPYLEDSVCQVCQGAQGPFFCRDMACFRYYCRTCWQISHSNEVTALHKPLMRNNKGQS